MVYGPEIRDRGIDFPFSVCHLPFVIGAHRWIFAMTNDKSKMENGKSTDLE
jgi:hypothetical protein